MLKRSILSVLFVGAVVFIAGCGEERPAGMPKIYPATMTVTYDDGTPADGATVLLIAPKDSPATGWTCGGTTGPDGTVELRTHGRFLGAPEGTFKVTVMRAIGETGDPDPSTMTDEEYQKAMERFKASLTQTVNYNMIEAEYGAADKTPLEITVEPKKGQKFTLTVGEPIKDAI